MTGASARLMVAAACAVAVAACHAGPDDATLETLLRGMEYRHSRLERIACEAVIEQTSSDAYRRRLHDNLRERIAGLVRAVTERSGPEGASAICQDLPDYGEHDALWTRSVVDWSTMTWSLQSVALANGGQPNSGCRLDAGPRAGRDLPPGLFYCACTCDGQTVRRYDRSTQEGSVRWFEGEHQLDDWYHTLQSSCFLGLPRQVVRAWRGGGLRVQYEGTRAVPPWPECHQVLLLHRDDGGFGADRLVICPALGFAVVQGTSCTTVTATPPMSFAFHTSAGDFVQVADGIWCPSVARTDQFAVSEEPIAAEWTRSIVCRVLDVHVGDEVRPPGGLPFPFDARVTDHTGDDGVPAPPPVPEGPVSAPDHDSLSMGALVRAARGDAE